VPQLFPLGQVLKRFMSGAERLLGHFDLDY
jgi:hypothetical protein